jgi:hypothetical protein
MTVAKSSGKKVVELALKRTREIRGPKVGWLAMINDGPRVDYPGNPHGPLEARTIVPLARETLEQAVAAKREVLLSFEQERSDRPIILGFVEPLPSTTLPPIVRTEMGANHSPHRPAEAGTNLSPLPRAGEGPGEGAKVAVSTNTHPGEPLEALVDGKRVVLDAQDEIVLRCGSASITLRRNGRVVVRGTYVETRSQGVNRIKGGSVQIN